MKGRQSIMTQEEYDREIERYLSDPIIRAFNRSIECIYAVSPVSSVINNDWLDLQLPKSQKDKIKELEKERDEYIKNTYSHI